MQIRCIIVATVLYVGDDAVESSGLQAKRLSVNTENNQVRMVVFQGQITSR